MSATRMTASSPTPSFVSHFVRALADSWIITWRDLLHWKQQPAAVLIAWSFPILTLLMFATLFGGAISVPSSSYFDFLIPGIFTLTMFFGLETTITAVTNDTSRGVTDRFRSMPLSSVAVVLGRCLADMLHSIVGLAIMLITALLMGWRWHTSLFDVLLAVGLLLLLRFALLWIGIYLGLVSKGTELVTAVQIFIWPISSLSSIFVDPATMPAWLATIALWNPISSTASAVRQLFGNPGWQSSAWIVEHAIPMAILWPIILTAIFLPLAAHTYRHLRR